MDQNHSQNLVRPVFSGWQAGSHGLNPGNTTDKDIVKHDGILRQLQPGDGVLADKGFIMEDLDLIPEGEFSLLGNSIF